MSECRCFRLVDARYAGEKGSVIQAREGCPIHCRRNPPRMPPVPSGTFVPVVQARDLYRALDNLTEAISEELDEHGPPFFYTEACKLLMETRSLRDENHVYPWKERVVFQGTLGPACAGDVMSTPGAFFRKYGVGP